MQRKLKGITTEVLKLMRRGRVIYLGKWVKFTERRHLKLKRQNTIDEYVEILHFRKNFFIPISYI